MFITDQTTFARFTGLIMRPLRLKDTLVNPKTAKLVLKISLMGASALLYGFAHKAEKKLNEKIDNHFAEPETTPED